MTVQPPVPASAPAEYAPAKTNTLAIIALVAAFVIPIVAIVLGHLALSQIKRTGESGRLIALWGTILGYIFTAVYIIWFVGLFIVAMAVQTGVTY